MWLFLRLAKAPPARRGKGYATRTTPPGIHMPGPSFAPIFAGVGVFLVMLGLVFGGMTLILGLIALVLTLLYWLAEGLRLYDRDIGPTSPDLPVVVHDGPPPGVHMPGPSWRPFLGAFGVFALFLGLVFGGWLLAVGVIALIATLVGWLTDAVLDYRRTIEGERTGHIDNGPPPPTPRRLLTVLTVLIVGAAVLQSGVFITDRPRAPVRPGPSASPAASLRRRDRRRPDLPSLASRRLARDRRRHDPRQGHRVRRDVLHGTGRQAVHDRLRQRGPGTSRTTSSSRTRRARSPTRARSSTASRRRVYDVPALAAGTYPYVCTVHTNMTGTATLQ